MQAENAGFLPVNEQVLENLCEYAPPGEYSFTDDTGIAAKYEVTQEHTKEVMDQINALSGSAHTTNSLYSIVFSGYDSCINGSKTADEASEEIKNRVNIYLSEQYG